MTRKALAVLPCIALALAACGGKSSPSTNAGNADSTPAASVACSSLVGKPASEWVHLAETAGCLDGGTTRRAEVGLGCGSSGVSVYTLGSYYGRTDGPLRHTAQAKPMDDPAYSSTWITCNTTP